MLNLSVIKDNLSTIPLYCFELLLLGGRGPFKELHSVTTLQYSNMDKILNSAKNGI